MITLKKLIETRSRDELLQVFSFLQGKVTVLKLLGSYTRFFLDTDIVNLAQVCRSWRYFIIEIDGLRDHLKELEKLESRQQSIDFLDNFYPKYDEVSLYCHLKKMQSSGVVYGWGFNYFGELTKPLWNDSLPQQLVKFGNCKSIVAGEETSFIIRNNGVFALGFNDHSRLGLGENCLSEVHEPQKVKIPPVKSLVSRESSFAIDLNGKLWSWGFAWTGQLGHDLDVQTYAVKEPRMVESLKRYKVEQVACGRDFACCLTSNGDVFVWGDYFDTRVPKKLQIEKISQIASGEVHVLLLSTDRKNLWSLGDNSCGKLGHPRDQLATSKDPIKVPLSINQCIIKVQCGDSCSAVLTKDGKLILWGSLSGKLEENGHQPQVINKKQIVVDISMSSNFILALTKENRLYAFGTNRCGQCGLGKVSEFVQKPTQGR